MIFLLFAKKQKQKHLLSLAGFHVDAIFSFKFQIAPKINKLTFIDVRVQFSNFILNIKRFH